MIEANQGKAPSQYRSDAGVGATLRPGDSLDSLLAILGPPTTQTRIRFGPRGRPRTILEYAFPEARIRAWSRDASALDDPPVWRLVQNLVADVDEDGRVARLRENPNPFSLDGPRRQRDSPYIVLEARVLPGPGQYLKNTAAPNAPGDVEQGVEP